jgi:hypothetical protein
VTSLANHKVLREERQVEGAATDRARRVVAVSEVAQGLIRERQTSFAVLPDSPAPTARLLSRQSCLGCGVGQLWLSFGSTIVR